MKFDIRSIPPLEIILFLVFFIYLVFSVPTPLWLNPWLHTSFGLMVVFFVTLYLVLYTTPVLGILSVFVAYELLRRSSVRPSFSPQQPKINRDIQQMNEVYEETKIENSLEEEIVQKMAPIQPSYNPTFIESSFKPVSNKVRGSLI